MNTIIAISELIRNSIGGAVALVLIIVALFFKGKEKSKKPIILKEDQPDWKMSSRLQGALISPTRSIFSTHIQRNKIASVSYKGVEYKVTDQRVIEDDRAEAVPDTVPSYNSNMGTDITILDHEPVLITPVKIAESDPKNRDRVTAYFSNRVVSGEIREVGKSIAYLGSAVGGDSSSPVVDKNGDLVALNSMSIGYGPNLVRIRDILLK